MKSQYEPIIAEATWCGIHIEASGRFETALILLAFLWDSFRVRHFQSSSSGFSLATEKYLRWN